MSETINIVISAPIYWGFKYNMNKDLYNLISSNETIKYIKKKMLKFFTKYNLLELKDGVKDLDLHIHDRTPMDNTVYICSH